MKRTFGAAIVFGLVAVAAYWAQSPAAGARPLSAIVPAGGLLYLEAKDFAALLSDWNASAEKKTWLASANCKAFGNSRLFQRLGDAATEFGAAAGLATDMTLAQAVAGTESAIAIYDIGKLEFLYVTRLATARAVETALYKARQDWTPRNAGGKPYFVKSDSASKRMAAFAVSDGLLLLATRETAMAEALMLLAGQGGRQTAQEPWYRAAVAAAGGAAGDLRLVLNMPELLATPHFRSYWVQRNITELKAFSAGIIDLRRSATEIREERVLLRKEAGTAVSGAVLGEVLKLAPADAGLYRGWAQPSSEEALALLVDKLLAPKNATGSDARNAPPAASGVNEGSEADVETRIDEAPEPIAMGSFAPEPLRRVFVAAKVEAMLEAQSSRVLADQVFVVTPVALAFLGAADWNAVAVRDALSSAVEGLYTTSKLGLNWSDRQGVSVLDGLLPLAVAVRGRLLIVGSTPEMTAALAARQSAPVAATTASYAATFRLSREAANFNRITRLIDATRDEGAGEDAPPAFFSANIASIGRTMRRMQTTSIVSVDTGGELKQTVTYQLAP